MEEERGRGRPLGSKNKAAQFRSYQPKRWLPWMDALVLASLTNANQTELAEQFGIHKCHVSNILSSPQCHVVREVIRKRLLETDSKLEVRLAKIQELALGRVEKVLESDGAFQANPWKVAEISLAALKLTGADRSKQEDRPAENQTTINMSGNILIANPEIMGRVAAALEASNKVQELHSGKVEFVGGVRDNSTVNTDNKPGLALMKKEA